MLNAKQNHEISLIAVTDRSNSRIVNIQVWTCPISGGSSFRFPLSPPSSSSPEKGQFNFPLSLSFVCLLVSASPFYLIQLLNMVSSFSVCVPTHRIVDQRWNFCFFSDFWDFAKTYVWHLHRWTKWWWVAQKFIQKRKRER